MSYSCAVSFKEINAEDVYYFLKLLRRHYKIKIWKDNTGGKNESKYE